MLSNQVEQAPQSTPTHNQLKNTDPSLFFAKRTALLERFLAAKKLGVDDKPYRDTLDEINKMTFKTKNIEKPAQRLDVLSVDLEKAINDATEKRLGEQLVDHSILKLDWQSYGKILESKIPGSWYTPKCISFKPIKVQFDIYSSGIIKNIVVAKSSGSKMVDDSAVRSVKNASPFLPFKTETACEKVEFLFDRARGHKASLTSDTR